MAFRRRYRYLPGPESGLAGTTFSGHDIAAVAELLEQRRLRMAL